MKRFSLTQACTAALILALLLTALSACRKDPPKDPEDSQPPVTDTGDQTDTGTEKRPEAESESETASEPVNESESASESESESESGSESESVDDTRNLFSKNGIEFYYPKSFTVSHQSGSMTQLMDANSHASIAPTITVNINKIAANKDGTPRYDSIPLITDTEDFEKTHPSAENIALDVGEKRTTVTYEETPPSSQRTSYYTYIQIVSEPTENGELTYASIQVREYSSDRTVSAGLFED